MAKQRTGQSSRRGHRALAAILACVAGVASGARASCPDESTVAVQVLGSGGPEATDQRASSGYLIWYQGRARLLVDAGPGTALRFEQAGAKLEDLTAVLFTHLHVDHSAGLPNLIKASFFTQRRDDLLLYGPAGNDWLPDVATFTQRLFGTEGAYPYLSDYLIPQEQSGSYAMRPQVVAPQLGEIFSVALDSHIQISATRVHHGPLPALAWRVDIDALSVTFTGDTNNAGNTVAPLAQSTTLLVAHNAIPEGAGEAARGLHMTPSDIGQLAQAAKPKAMVLSHIMTRSAATRADTLKIIGNHYSGPVKHADDLSCYPLAAETTSNPH